MTDRRFEFISFLLVALIYARPDVSPFVTSIWAAVASNELWRSYHLNISLPNLLRLAARILITLVLRLYYVAVYV